MSTQENPNRPQLDERGNRPSASMMHRLFACPASWLLSFSLPKAPPSPDAERGTKIHLAIENEDPTSLNEDELDIYQSCLNIVVENFIEKVRPEGDYKTEREERMWSKNGLYSGKADVIFSWDDWDGDTQIHCVAIADYKTGNIPAEAIEENRQLQTLADLYYQKHKDEYPDDCEWVVFAAVIQPLVTHTPTILRLGRKELEDIAEENARACEHAVGAGSTEFAITSHGCRYCPALGICPRIEQKRKELGAVKYEELSIEEREQKYIDCLLVQKAMDVFMERVKRDILTAHDEGKESPYVRLKYKNGAKRASVSDVRRALSEIMEIMAPMQNPCDTVELLDYATISKASIEKFAKKVLSQEVHKPIAKQFLSTMMKVLDERGIVTYTTNSPSVMLK